MTSNNIIQFPTAQVSAELEAEVQVEAEENKRKYVDEIMNHYATQLLNKMAFHGFDITDDVFVTQYATAIELLKYTMCESLNIEHEFKYIFDELVGTLEEDLFPEEYDSE